jgi:two-component system cell cycle sensor histidine kinase/response regulator CckA
MGEPGSKEVQHVILLVEPNRSLCSLIASVLTKEGYSVLPANTSEEALELSREIAGIDLIITDVFLPGASGIELAARLAQLNPQANILYLSSIAEPALRQQGIGDRASVLVKPLALSDLVSRVDELLRTS